MCWFVGVAACRETHSWCADMFTEVTPSRPALTMMHAPYIDWQGFSVTWESVICWTESI